MSPQSKREYLEAIVPRYRNASRKSKTSILSEFCSTCGYHRKHAVRLINTLGYGDYTRLMTSRHSPPPR